MNVFTFKFFKLLQTFSTEELKAFGIWLRSPWCNTNKSLVRLLEKTRKYHPDYTQQSLTKERLFRQVLPEGKYSENRMNNLLSKGYLAAERFITFQYLSQQSELRNQIITKELQNRSLDEWFFKEADKNIVALEQKEIKSWEDHYELLQLLRGIYHHPGQNPRMQPGGTTIVKMGEQIDLLFLLEKAAIINEKISRNRILKNENHDIAFDLNIWQQAANRFDHPAILLYKLRFEYTADNMLEKYQQLKKTYLAQFKNLNQKEKKIHLISLINDSVVLIRAKKIDLSARLPLYKLGLENGFLLSNGVLSLRTFVSILTDSNMLKDFDYSSFVIDTYIQYLDFSFQKDALQWALAHKAYHQKKLEICLELLLHYEFDEHYFKIISKTLTTQLYFDLFLKDTAYHEYLFNYFDSFEKWLHREKSRSKFNKHSFLRLIQLCRKLAKYYLSTPLEKEQLRNLLKDENNIQAPLWIKQKIEEVIALKDS